MKTKMNIKSIILIAIICLSSLFFINMSFAANTAKITVETANLRETASSDSKILELVSQGEEVEILEKSGEWYKVKYKKITGYLRNDLLEVKEDKVTTESNNVSSNEVTGQNDENVTNNEVEGNATNENEQNSNQEDENTSSNNNESEKNDIDNGEQNTTPEQNKEEKQIGTYKVQKDSKLKITPLINSLDIKEVKKDEQIEVTDYINDWAYMTTSIGEQGWMRMNQLEKVKSNEQNPNGESSGNTENNSNNTDTQKSNDSKDNTNTQTTNLNKKMYVNTQTINVREKADKTSKLVTQLSINTEVTAISESDGWYYVDIKGKKGYISKSLLSDTKQQTSRSSINDRDTKKTENNSTENKTNTSNNSSSSNDTQKNDVSNTSTSTGNSAKGSEVVAYAKNYLGCKYVYGGTTPSKGFDCSGFTQYVYKNFGISLNRTAAAQYSNGKSVTSLQAGDLVMFGKSGINHVGIYIGGNTFIHSANPSRGVTIDSLSSGYYKNNYVGARRIF